MELELFRDKRTQDLLHVRGILQIFAAEIFLHALEDDALDSSWMRYIVQGDDGTCGNPFNAHRAVAKERREYALNLVTHALDVAVENTSGLAVEPAEPLDIDDGAVGDDPCVEVFIEKVPQPPHDGEGRPTSRQEDGGAVREQDGRCDREENGHARPDDGEENDAPMLVDDFPELFVLLEMPSEEQALTHGR